MPFRNFALALVATWLPVAPALAESVTVGDLAISDP